MNGGKYETGNRKPVERNWPDPADEFSQDAAENRRPPASYGNAAPVDEDEEKVRHSDGQNPPGYYENIGNAPRGSEEPGYLKRRKPAPKP